MKMNTIWLAALILLAACRPKEKSADAYGNFEVDAVTVGAQANGALVFFDVAEGENLTVGQWIGLVDTTTLHLQKLQLWATRRALGQKTQDPQPQIEVLKEQKRALEREKARFEALVADKAATPKQLDDIKSQLDVVNQQIEAARSQANRANKGILSEGDPLEAQIKVVEEQIRKCYVYNPIGGTVLTKIAEPGEVVGFGSPLYRIAKLDTLMLRAYVSGDQLGQLKIGQKLSVKVDAGKEQMRSLTGRLTWIAQQSEFTPKTIQTKEERVNLVYAVKIAVANDGSLKVGMPGEVYFNNSSNLAKQ